MDVVVLFNGLGNQMSQYCLYLAKKRDGQIVSYFPTSNAHNGYELDRLFNISHPNKLTKLATQTIFDHFFADNLKHPSFRRRLGHRLRMNRYDEAFDYNHHSAVSAQGEGLRYLIGGWHAEKYFEHIAPEVVQIFRFPDVTDATNTAALSRIKDTVSISLHVRRGDYNDHLNQPLFGSVCSPEFYQRALEEMRLRVPDFLLVVFSNDPAWAHEHIRHQNTMYVTWNHGNDSWIDMFLMSQCTHNIICNSTFGWWGAWLNQFSEKVVLCPDRFIATELETEVYPASWIRVKSAA